jgi:hypothetical protein
MKKYFIQNAVRYAMLYIILSRPESRIRIKNLLWKCSIRIRTLQNERIHNPDIKLGQNSTKDLLYHISLCKERNIGAVHLWNTVTDTKWQYINDLVTRQTAKRLYCN